MYFQVLCVYSLPMVVLSWSSSSDSYSSSEYVCTSRLSLGNLGLCVGSRRMGWKELINLSIETLVLDFVGTQSSEQSQLMRSKVGHGVLRSPLRRQTIKITIDRSVLVLDILFQIGRRLQFD